MTLMGGIDEKDITMSELKDGVLTCRAIKLTDEKGRVVIELHGSAHNSGLWIRNRQTGHLLFLSANDQYTGVGIYEKEGTMDTAKVSFALTADGKVYSPDFSPPSAHGVHVTNASMPPTE